MNHSGDNLYMFKVLGAFWRVIELPKDLGGTPTEIEVFGTHICKFRVSEVKPVYTALSLCTQPHLDPYFIDIIVILISSGYNSLF